MNKIKEMLKKYREVIMYLIIGVLTTIINYIIFVIAYKCGIEENLSNIIAWIICVIVAYITNKIFVFESKSFKKKVLFGEIVSFIISRIATLGMEEIIIFVFVTKLQFNAYIVKLMANILVIILNYIFSKFIIFKKNKK